VIISQQTEFDFVARCGLLPLLLLLLLLLLQRRWGKYNARRGICRLIDTSCHGKLH
jgi:hypothetical protein